MDVTICDVGPRDGLQNDRGPTSQIVTYISLHDALVGGSNVVD